MGRGGLVQEDLLLADAEIPRGEGCHCGDRE